MSTIDGSMPTVLIIDDNGDIAKALEVSLGLHDIETRYAESPEQGLNIIAGEPVDLVIQDMNFTSDTTSGKEGVELFHRIREVDADLPFILLTAWTDLETAVELVRAGAADYLGKPWDEEKLLTSVKNLLELREVQTAHGRLVRERRDLRPGRCPRSSLRRYAQTNGPFPGDFPNRSVSGTLSGRRLHTPRASLQPGPWWR